MPNLNEIKEAVEIIEAQKNYWGGDDETLQTLLTLAQQVLSAKCPEERSVYPDNPINNYEIVQHYREQGYNLALSDFRIYQAKCLGELKPQIEKIVRELTSAIDWNYDGAEDEEVERVTIALLKLFEGLK